jgi:F0F1-type ATP synthase membrane subunit c/vacuolar-type H+-ATPase subunit K
MKLQVCVAAALAVGMGSAMAATYNIGSVPVAPAVYSNVVPVPVGAFSDLYSFIFPATASTVSGSAITVDVGVILNIDNLQVSILDSGMTTLSSGSVGESSVLFNQALMVGSSYFFKVTGMASGIAGGTYAFLASADPVPEPATFGMMFAGAALLGALAKRRRAA